MTRLAEAFDFIVIGAGMAGASVAAELSGEARVLLLETESQPGYHTTGRSAALFTRAYGPPAIRALTRASEPFFNDPQSRYLDHKLLRQRGAMFIARSDQAEALAALQAELGDEVRPVDADHAREMAPLLRQDYVARALLDKSAADIDVAALHQHFLKTFRAAGGVLRTDAEVTTLVREGANWLVQAGQDQVIAPVVVNAAGAWADGVAKLAAVAPIGLVPKRRTALLVSPPDDASIEEWPMVVDVDEQFYMKPDAGKLLISPADETPSPPCDAQPDEMDVAICVDRIETAFELRIRRIDHKWAGLRSFVADKCPVVGFDADMPGFFWLAGQGGYGIQTAPALARTAAALALGQPVPDDIRQEGVEAAALSSHRMTGAA